MASVCFLFLRSFFETHPPRKLVDSRLPNGLQKEGLDGLNVVVAHKSRSLQSDGCDEKNRCGEGLPSGQQQVHRGTACGDACHVKKVRAGRAKVDVLQPLLNLRFLHNFPECLG